MILDKNKIYVIDNLVPEIHQKGFYETLTNKPQSLQWYEHPYVPGFQINSPKYTKCIPESQFSQLLEPTKKMFTLKYLEKTLNIKVDKILRMKINWVTREHSSNSKGFYPPHTDHEIEHWTLLYYVNTSDGDTLIFDETEKEIPFRKVDIKNISLNIKESVKHLRGRGVLFYGSTYHCGTPPIKNNIRITINHNFTIKK